jgi:hypothetical protein
MICDGELQEKFPTAGLSGCSGDLRIDGYPTFDGNELFLAVLPPHWLGLDAWLLLVDRGKRRRGRRIATVLGLP